MVAKISHFVNPARSSTETNFSHDSKKGEAALRLRAKFNHFLYQISNGVKTHQNEMILTIGVILISLFSFSIGYLTAENERKTPIKFENTNQ